VTSLAQDRTPAPRTAAPAVARPARQGPAEPAEHGLSVRGLLLAMALLAAIYVAAGHVSPGPGRQIQQTFGWSLNAGVVLALALLPTRRQFPLLLGLVGFFSLLVRLPTDPLPVAALIALSNLPAVLAFRLLALRFVADGTPLATRRRLLGLFGSGLAGVAISATIAESALRLGEAAGSLGRSAVASTAFLLVWRPLAQCDGLVTVVPLVLLLVRRRPASWSWRAWGETGCWLAALTVVGVAAVELPTAEVLDPLLVLMAFAAMVLAVLRRGELAAAVLCPAFAVAVAGMLFGASGPGAPAGASMPAVPLSQVAALVAGVLAWSVATVVGERDEARRLAQSEAAAQQALTTLQAALLPAHVTSQRNVTVAARYCAAGAFDQVGGDWYDTIALPAGGLGLVIGDVEGHDLTAASVMGLVRGAVRSHALEGHPPSVVLQRVAAFLPSAGIDRLITMAYVELSPHDRTATVALAGHPPPLLVPASGEASLLRCRSGPVLGVPGLAGWPEQTVSLPSDASLALYTDGLVDYPTPSGDRRPDPADLVDVVARLPDRDVDRLADGLIGIASGYDDAAVLVARLTLRDAGPAERAFPARPSSAGIARVWLGDLFTIWNAAGLVPELAGTEVLDTAQLLLTELVSNAVRHSDHRIAVRLHVCGPRLRVEVEDTSDRLPVMRDQEDAATEGRGLRLVDSLADAWGVQMVARGKAVWFEVTLQE